MTRLVIITLVAAVLAGCRGLAPGASGAPAHGRPTASAVPGAGSSATAPIVPASHAPDSDECSLGFGIAEHHYPGLRQFAGFSDGVAIAEVVSVSDLQYSTETGERPSCQYIDEAQAVFGVGRMVELRVEAPVAGRGRSGETLRYLFPGGAIGGDSSPGHHYGVPLPAVGDRMLVMLLDPPADVDPGEGVLEVDVLELFQIANGRIVTPDRNERVTVDNVRDVVRGAVPSAAPGG